VLTSLSSNVFLTSLYAINVAAFSDCYVKGENSTYSVRVVILQSLCVSRGPLMIGS